MVDLSSLDWHGLRGGGSDALYKIGGRADNPEEDARACIDLLKAKIKNGGFLPRLFVLR